MYSQRGHRISKTEILISVFSLFLLPFVAFAQVELLSLLPNPLGTDELGEYIEIRNTGCASVDIGGYHLYDAANKTYILPTGTIIGFHSNLTLSYSQTKIALNNTGNESITLTDTGGIIVDREVYSGTQRDNIVIYLTTTDEDCSVTIPIGSDTGPTSTGTTESESGILDTLEPILSGTGEGQNTGTTNTGTRVTDVHDNSSTGDTDATTIDANTGTTDSGSMNIGSGDSTITYTGTILYDSGTTRSETTDASMGNIAISTGIIQNSNTQIFQQSNTGLYNVGVTVVSMIFPDIIPTRQEPTNAVFTGGVWDCGTHQPCRINVTFDPIFTGGLLEKNYICGVITATGTLTTCNPNTLYFSTGSSFSFRLTSKVDPSQSRMVSWDVRFSVLQNSTSIGLEIDGLIGEINAGIIDIYTGMTNTGAIQDPNSLTLQQTRSGVIFPEIVPTYQNYTNTSHSGDTLTCVTSPCRVNFTLDPIFTGGLLAKSYTCVINYGTGQYDSCNPPQLYLIGTGSIEIILTHRASGQKETKTFEIVQTIPIVVITTPGLVSMTPSIPDTNPPIAILEFDGKLQSYYEQIDTYEFNCYTLTCSVNLNADRSYDPGGGKVRFLWYYGPNDIRITRDPGGRKYGLGDHEIWLRVMDIAGNMSEIRYRIHVLGPKNEEEKIKTKKTKDLSLTKTKRERSGDPETSGGQKKKKKKKPKKMDFFDPPTITLQKSKFIEIDGGYLCRTKTKTCSLNLTLSGVEKGIMYNWAYDDGEVISSKNPRSQKLSLGSHEIVVTASYSGSTDVLWTQTISARVDKITKPKKAKKQKISARKTTPKKEIKPTIIHLPEAEQPTDDIPYTTMALLGGIIPVLLLRRFLMGII